MNRVCVFIDGGNFYFGLKRNNYMTRVEYHQLSLALTGPDRQLVRTYYYNAGYDPVLQPDQWKAQQPFFESLTKTPFLDLRLGRIISSREGGFKEKGSDVRMAGDVVYYAARNIYDTAIVITEDTDFSPALNQVREMGKNVELCFFLDIQPRELVKLSDLVIHLPDVFEKFGSKIFMANPEENIGTQVEDISSSQKPLKANSRVILKNKI